MSDSASEDRSPPNDRLLTANEAQDAIFVDFESRENEEPVVVGSYLLVSRRRSARWSSIATSHRLPKPRNSRYRRSPV
jgi:hypothetical protein